MTRTPFERRLKPVVIHYTPFDREVNRVAAETALARRAAYLEAAGEIRHPEPENRRQTLWHTFIAHLLGNQPRDEHHCPSFRSCYDHPRWTVWKCNTDEHRTCAHSPDLPWIVNRPGPYHLPDAQEWHIEWHAATHQEAISLAHRKASD